jgi:carnitine-CoA ligase
MEQRFVPELPVTEMTVAKVLEGRMHDSPDTPFLRVGPEWTTYAQVDSRANQVASGLTALGCAKGEFVALFMPTCMEFIDIYLAMSKAGIVMSPINTGYRGYILEYVLNDTGCRVAFASLALLPRLSEAETQLERLETVVVVDANLEQVADAGRQFERLQLRTYREFLDSGRAENRLTVSYGDANCIIYTSGTTGPSKGVLLSNAHAVSKALEVAEICRIGAPDVIYSPMPLFHSFALLRGVLTAMAVGGACVLRDRFSASAYWDDVREVGATVGHSVLSIPNILKKAPVSPRDREHSLRVMYNASYDPEFEERFGVKLVEGYGLTEANTATYVRYDESPRPGSCGRESPDWEVRLVDDADEDVSVGAPGEIVLRPRRPFRIMLGYHNKADATLAAWRNLWFHTGDLASRDEAGYFYFKDRKKDAIRRRGENISSWEVERILCEHPAVVEAAVLPYPSELGEDDVWALVCLREGETLTAADLLSYCERRMPDFMVPRYLEFRDQLMKTPTGRIEKYKIREAGLGPEVTDRGDGRRRSG